MVFPWIGSSHSGREGRRLMTSAGAEADALSQGKLQIRWVKSSIGYSRRQKGTIRALGLRHLGDVVELRTFQPINDRRKFKGVLVSVDSESVSLECDGKTLGIPFAELDRARLCYFDSHEQ